VKVVRATFYQLRNDELTHMSRTVFSPIADTLGDVFYDWHTRNVFVLEHLSEDLCCIHATLRVPHLPVVDVLDSHFLPHDKRNKLYSLTQCPFSSELGMDFGISSFRVPRGR
jgi:hypothetical protein